MDTFWESSPSHSQNNLQTKNQKPTMPKAPNKNQSEEKLMKSLLKKLLNQLLPKFSTYSLQKLLRRKSLKKFPTSIHWKTLRLEKSKSSKDQKLIHQSWLNSTTHKKEFWPKTLKKFREEEERTSKLRTLKPKTYSPKNDLYYENILISFIRLAIYIVLILYCSNPIWF